MKYEKVTNDFGVEFITRDNGDGTITWIPINESSADYQAYAQQSQNGANL